MKLIPLYLLLMIVDKWKNRVLRSSSSTHWMRALSLHKHSSLLSNSKSSSCVALVWAMKDSNWSKAWRASSSNLRDLILDLDVTKKASSITRFELGSLIHIDLKRKGRGLCLELGIEKDRIMIRVKSQKIRNSSFGKHDPPCSVHNCPIQPFLDISFTTPVVIPSKTGTPITQAYKA